MVKRNRKTRRNKNIYALRRIGISYRVIAEYHGLSIIRVRQIIEAQEAAGIYPEFDWNEWNRQNMEKLAKRMEQEAADAAIDNN